MISDSIRKDEKIRDESLDYMKGVLIFFVVYGHCLYWMGEGIAKPYTFIAKFIYSFHMPLFVFLSGYFFSTKKSENIIINIDRKFKRLIVPHFFFNIIMIIPIFCFWEQFGHFITRETNGTITLKSIYLYLTMFWYLWCVFLSSILCNIIFTICKKHPREICILISLIFLCFSQYTSINIFFIHQRMGDMFFYFVLGVVIYDYKAFLKSIIIILLSFVIYLCYLSLLYNCNDIHPIIVEIGQFGGIITMYNIIILLYKIKIANNLFVYFSKWTLGIYIYHFVLLYGLMGWFNNTFCFLNNSLVFYHIIFAILATLTSALFSQALASYYPLSKYALGYK